MIDVVRNEAVEHHRDTDAAAQSGLAAFTHRTLQIGVRQALHGGDQQPMRRVQGFDHPRPLAIVCRHPRPVAILGQRRRLSAEPLLDLASPRDDVQRGLPDV